ncbi:polyphosphate kinase 1, partial [bacterium]
WLAFNRRVLEEAASDLNPLLERLRFLAIFESNLDEFYMVRVSGLIEQFEAGVLETSPDGLTPNDQLHAITGAARPLRARAAEIYQLSIAPALEAQGIAIRRYEDLSPKVRKELSATFLQEIFPLCTPLLLSPAPSVPFISNRSLNLAVELEDEAREMRLIRLKIPTVLPRAMRLRSRKHEYVLLEDVIRHNLQAFFSGVKIRSAHLFRVLRDADVEIRELEAADLISAIEETLRLRRFGDPVLLEHEPGMPANVRAELMRLHGLDEDDVIAPEGILGMEVFHEIARIDRPALRYPPLRPYLGDVLATPGGLFETIAAHDVLLHHPYDSFRPVEEFVASAAKDPSVVGIKQTLYRVGTESPIVESLLDAAEEGKQVAAMVELKARFDESNNLTWSRALERAGAHVTYGFAETKTHCKLSLVVRREKGVVKQYAHIGTGNYNPATARHYTDLGLLTDDPEIAQDISELFNVLTGFSKQSGYRKLLVAPLNLRDGILARIRRE